MEKIDFKKTMKHLYSPSKIKVVEVDVPEANYLMVDGEGDPNTSQTYQEAIEALYAVSYAIKFAVKRGPLAIDYGVMPLEGLWWCDDMACFTTDDKSKWKWTMMIFQPPFVSGELIESAILEVQRKKGLAAISKLYPKLFLEGKCAQIMHIGPFSEEAATVERVHQFVDAYGQRTGKHHEIYLSDIRKTNPANWKTIIRQPMTY